MSNIQQGLAGALNPGTLAAGVQSVGGGKTIDGATDVVQLRVQGHSTQTTNILEIETSAAADLVTVNNSGQIMALAGFISANGNTTVNSDANTTLDLNSSDVQVMTPTADRTYTLPTTGILAGRTFKFINLATDFDIILNASNTSALTAATSGMLPTCRDGYVIVQALQNTPTTPAHWRVVEVNDCITTTVRFVQSGGYSQEPAVKCTRVNRNATVYMAAFVSATATAVNATIATDIPLPRGFRPADTTNIMMISRDNVSFVPGWMAVDSTGGITFYRTLLGEGFTIGQTAGLAYNGTLNFRTV